jgi:K+-sensing histidine kinase KdpD
MKRTQIPGWWNPVIQFVLGAAILAGMTAVFFQFGFHLAIVAPAYLVLIVGVSLLGGVIPALGVTILATGLLAYYFADPIFSFAVASAEEAIALLAFILTTLVIVTIVHRIKASEAQLRARPPS